MYHLINYLKRVWSWIIHSLSHWKPCLNFQEILDFVLRDYVEPWYSVLTNDEEFTKSVRDTAQKIAINIANR